MFPTNESATATGLQRTRKWLSAVGLAPPRRLRVHIPLGSHPPPLLHIKFHVAARSVVSLLRVFPNSRIVDTSTAPYALEPRNHPKGFECIVPAGLEEGTALYRRWEEYCGRAEREYAQLVKALDSPAVADSVLPACVAHNVDVYAFLDEFYDAAHHVFSSFADSAVKELRPVFRELIARAYENCDEIFKGLYAKSAADSEEEAEDAEMAGEGEAAEEGV